MAKGAMSGFQMVYMVWYEPVKATITEKSVEHTKSGFDDANSSTNVSQNGNLSESDQFFRFSV